MKKKFEIVWDGKKEIVDLEDCKKIWNNMHVLGRKGFRN